MTKLEGANIIVATHIYVTGPALDLEEYLIDKKINKLLFIGHPLFYHKKLKGSGYEYYQLGKKIKENYRNLKKTPAVFSYIHNVIYTIILTVYWREKWDIFIGSDNLNAFSGIILKKMGFINKVVYYVIDYTPNRFDNKILNKIYHWLDKFCVTYSDETWNLSPRMSMGRKKYFKFSGGVQKTVPIGIWFNRIKRVPFSKIAKHKLVFLGHIIKRQGIQHVISAIPIIVKKIPDFHFLVIGDGDYLDELKENTETRGIKKYVKFTGYIRDHKKIENMLVTCAVAVALYEKYVDGKLNLTNFSDPGKIKSYTASGLPIILTDVPHVAQEIERRKCGKIVELDEKAIAQAVIELMVNTSKLNIYRENAIAYARKYDWNIVFDKAFKSLL